MKNLFFAITLLTLIGCSTHPGVPRKVSKAFEKRFENAVNISWEINQTHLIASFKEGDFIKTAHFSENARWLRTTTSLSIENLSPCIIDSVYKDYPEMELIEIELIENILTKRYQIAVKNIIPDTDDEVQETNMTLPIRTNSQEKHVFETVMLTFDESCHFLSKK